MGNTGGPAFPRDASTANSLGIATMATDGMTLRDWFAGQALSAVIQNQMALTNALREVDRNFMWSSSFASKVAYGYADAMLKERERTHE